MPGVQGAYNEAVDMDDVTVSSKRVGEGLVFMYLLQPRLLKSSKGVLEGHGHVDSADGPRRLVRRKRTTVAVHVGKGF